METRKTMTDDTEKVELSSEKQPLWIKLSLWATVIGIAIITIFIIAKAVPWEPFKVYDYYEEPAVVCPFDRVHITQDVSLESSWWYSVGNLKGQTYWLDEEGKPFAGTYFDVPIEPFERDKLPSNSVRLAPPEPGYWYAGGEATLTGERLGFIGVSQEIKVVAEDPILVQEWDECSHKF